MKKTQKKTTPVTKLKEVKPPKKTVSKLTAKAPAKKTAKKTTKKPEVKPKKETSKKEPVKQIPLLELPKAESPNLMIVLQQVVASLKWEIYIPRTREGHIVPYAIIGRPLFANLVKDHLEKVNFNEALARSFVK
jgi:hypothetical protein